MAVNSSTARGDIFKEFYALIKSNTSGVKTTNAFVDDIAVMPQIVVNMPVLPRNRETFGTTTYDRSGEIDVEIYGTSMKQLTLLIDEIDDLIFNNLDQLSVQNIKLGESTIGSFDMNAKTVHTFTLPFSFTFKR